MREIRIHLGDGLGAILQGDLEPGQICGTQAEFPGAMDHAYPPGVLHGKFIGKLASAVRAVIVHHQ